MIAIKLNFVFMGKISKSSNIVANGPYKYSRNPFYLGQNIFSFGLLLFYSSFISSDMIFLASILFFLIIALTHITIIAEEERLVKKFGMDYWRYVNTTPRYLPKNIRLFIKAVLQSR